MNMNVRLSDLNQWMAWKEILRKNGTIGKPPVDYRTGLTCDGTDPANWMSLTDARAYAKAHNLPGVGFYLTEEDPFGVADLDNCILINGKLTPLATGVLGRLMTYAEITPSGVSLHTWVKTDAHIHFNQHDRGIEIYTYGQFMTWTGNRWPEAPNLIAYDAENVLADLDRLYNPKSKQAQTEQQQRPAEQRHEARELPADDDALWKLIFDKDKTDRAEKLFNGDLSAAGDNHSKAEILLANTLALWCQCDEVRMRRMMLQSGIKRDKWEKPKGNGDWLDYQIADAIAHRKSK